MTLSLLAYGIVLAAFLAAAAHFLDLALRSFGRPTRWIWITGMGATLVAPFLPSILPATGPTAATLGAGIPLEILYQVGGSTSAGPSGWATLIQALGRPVLPVWIGTSLLLVLIFLLTAFRLWKTGRGWATKTIGEEEVFLSEDLGPAVLGLFRPKIVLPPWALSLEERELGMVLLHEREHREARDPALLAAGTLLVLAAPLNPVLWWMLHRLRLAVEGDCDGRVLATGTPRRPYANLLLAVASRARGSFTLAPALTEGGKSFLERRLKMMQQSVRENRKRAAVGGVILGVFFLALACETPTPPAAAGGDESGAQVESLEVAAETAVPSEAGASADGNVWVLHGDSVSNGTDVLTANQGGVHVRLRDDAARDSQPQPLIIVDGVIISDPDILDNLETLDIESVEVIKGTAARELFGERAANGVIKIKTKNG